MDEKTDRIEIRKIDGKFRTQRTLIRSIAWVVVAYFAEQSLVSLSGQSTAVVVTATLSVIADLKFSLSVIFGGCATAWALAERMLRHRKVEKMHERIKSLEMRLDPNRSSSGLLPSGKTHPRDKED